MGGSMGDLSGLRVRHGRFAETHDDTPGLVLKTGIQTSVEVHGGSHGGLRGFHDTRGESRGTSGAIWGAMGELVDVTRRGLNRPKPMMTRVCKPPQKKKFQKNFFGVQLFFSRKKFFWFGGFLSSWVFYLKPNPCHHGFLDRSKPAVSSWVSTKPPVSHPIPHEPSPATPRDTLALPRTPRSPQSPSRSPPMPPRQPRFDPNP